MTEGYIRPPVVAVEPRSRKLAKWRFRAVVIVLLAGLAVGAFFVARSLATSGSDNSTVGGLAQSPSNATLLGSSAVAISH